MHDDRVKTLEDEMKQKSHMNMPRCPICKKSDRVEHIRGAGHGSGARDESGRLPNSKESQFYCERCDHSWDRTSSTTI